MGAFPSGRAWKRGRQCCQTDWSDAIPLGTVTPVTSRIVLFGATGYSGELTARALVKRGQLPVLAGRNADKLKHLAAELGDLEIAVADVERPRSVGGLVERGDVLVSAVGPFSRYGRPALAAAVNRGAHYVDSSAEPPFIQSVFENWSPRARASGCALLTAMGYEYVAGNLAAALALRDAGPSATQVAVGYFPKVSLNRSGLSGGTLASIASTVFAPGFARHGGVVSSERAGRRQRSFEVAGTQRHTLSLSGSEHYALPQTYPTLSDVDVYLEWPGRSAKIMTLLYRSCGGVLTLRPVRRAGHRIGRRLYPGSTGGPNEQTRLGGQAVVVAETFDARGNSLARVVLEGINPYDLTGGMVAWAADRIANVGVRGVGALGPVSAFGLDELTEGVRQAGMQRTE
jgi:short subunit dehydrogenase-like uncharacterized protein